MIIESNDTCWVYIRRVKNKTFSVELAIDLDQRITSLNGSCCIIYCKRFPSTIAALGHKLLLEHLSHQSVMRIIKKENPNLNDLRNTIN